MVLLLVDLDLMKINHDNMSNLHQCYYCFRSDKDLRPYGPNCSFICFSCMKEDSAREQVAINQFTVQVNACDNAAIIDGTNVGPYPLHRERH